MPEDGPQKKLGKKALQKLSKQRKLKRLKHKKQKNKNYSSGDIDRKER